MARIVIDDARPGERSAVTVFPQAVLDDVDALTHRRAHGDLAGQAPEARDTASSDSRDPFDRGVMLRHLEFYDSRARKRLSAFLDETSPQVRGWDDWMALTPEGAEAELRFVFKKVYGNNTLRTLASYLHRFMVRGLLRDWYLDAGIDTTVTGAELEGLLDDAAALLTPAYLRTPLWPFDPKR